MIKEAIEEERKEIKKKMIPTEKKDKSARKDTIGQNYYGVVTGYEWIKQNDEPHHVGLLILGGYRQYEDAKSEVKSKFTDDGPRVLKGDSVLCVVGGVLVGF